MKSSKKAGDAGITAVVPADTIKIEVEEKEHEDDLEAWAVEHMSYEGRYGLVLRDPLKNLLLTFASQPWIAW